MESTLIKDTKLITTTLLLILTIHSAQAELDCALVTQKAMTNPVETLSSLESMPQPDDVNEQACLYLTKASILSNRGAYEQARENILLAEQALNAADAPQFLLQNQLKIVKARNAEQYGETLQGKTLITEVINDSEQQGELDLLSEALFTRALLNDRTGASLLAIEDLQRAYKITQTNDTLVSNAQIAFALARVLRGTQDLEGALNYSNQALSYAIDNEISQAIVYSLQLKGDIQLQLNLLDEAQTSFRESIKYAEKIEDDLALSVALRSLGDILTRKENYEMALTYYLNTKQIYQQLEVSSMAGIHARIARTYLKLKSYQLAQENIDAAYAYTTDSPDFVNLRHQLNRMQAELHAYNGNYRDAYMVVNALEEEVENLEDQQQQETLMALQTSFEVDIQEQENQRLRADNALQSVLLENSQQLDRLYFKVVLLLLGLVSVLGFLMFRNRKHKAELTHIVNYDGLTKVFSRRRIMEVLKSALDNEFRVAVAIIDLDHFKTFNDVYEHAMGDKVLVSFAEYAKKYFSEIGYVGRIGGEEFLVVLPKHNAQEAKVLFEAFAQAIKEISKNIAINDPTTASIGVTCNRATKDLSALLSIADHAMYEAKRTGRDRVVLATE